jgi:hypothetical protein
VPKIRVPVGTTAGVGEMATWQAASLSLGVIGWAAFRGAAVLVGALLFAPVIYAFTRLHNHAPGVRSTSDLVGSTLGRRTASAAGLIQVAAYVLAAAAAAARLGLMVQLLVGDREIATRIWWAVVAVGAVNIVGVLTLSLSFRAVTVIVGVLVATALLVSFYLGLAVLARVWSGTPPVDMADQPPQSGPAIVDTVMWLAVAVAGFEICTTANSRLRSAGRPMAMAVAGVTGCAAVLWLADHLGATGGFRFAPMGLGPIVSEFFGESGAVWIVVSSLLANAAALFVLIAVAARIVRRQLEAATLQRPSRLATTTAVALPAAVLAAVATTEWAGTIVNGVWPILLLTLYVLVAHASVQIPGSGEFSWWTSAFAATVLAAVALLPLLAYGTLAAAWPTVAAAALVGVAFAIGWWQTRQPVRD